MQDPQFSIPTVDVSYYLEDSGSSEARDVIQQVRHACRTSGFFQITGHGIPAELQQEVFQAAELVFSLSTEEKIELLGKNGRGYEILGGQTLQPGAKPDLKEGYFVGPDLAPNVRPPFRDFQHPNIWPPSSLIDPSKFKTPLLKYQSLLAELSLKILQILAEGLPYCDAHTFDKFATNPIANIRLLHYPPQPNLDDKDQLGAGAHTDFGAITLLMQDANGGLQVLNQQTNEWIDVPPNPSAYVVNVGDMLDTWTKGEYRSNVHRVINRSGTHRYSVPFFFDGNVDYVLEPLDGSGDGKGPTVEEFMKERYRRTKTS
ncbi:uncharacterized protein PV09_09204 [Verruconis gallopava]|uniref:Fe2OG dioxygenase domain-containing protein n=1 Tax=Verruconis gallopava TaxID=253628 RepID=A0A0D1ZXD3_9PEZI|nr:uncharacterized protein PV09_09204 [Verruconis gallopava]KIV99107.1 hypothetical protein PV09_09204 [Verruconis gallopava]